MSDEQPDDGLTYALVLAFDTADAEFARGFELGLLYHRLAVEPLPVVGTIRAASAEMVLRIADAAGCRVTTREWTPDELTADGMDPQAAAETAAEWVEVCFGNPSRSGWADPEVDA